MEDNPSGPCLALKTLHKVYVMKSPAEADEERLRVNYQTPSNASTRGAQEINLFYLKSAIKTKCV